MNFIKVNQSIFEISNLNSIKFIDKYIWNKLVSSDNPLMSYDFFLALENSECTSSANGWEPHHFIVKNVNKIVGIIPNFIKTNSNGEYVFDHAWADAYHRIGKNYYPKYLSAIPFTPINGDRFFFSQELYENEKTEITNSLIKKVKKENIETFHFNFINKEQSNYLEKFGFLQRVGIQYHWNNQNYDCFEDFLSRLKSKKKKNILKERKYIKDKGIRVSCLKGSEIKEEDWDFFYNCYQNTISKKWSFKYLNFNFFRELSKSKILDNILLILAKDNSNKHIACTLNFVGEKLYGRYWGSVKEVPFLHFELCYYQSIEYAIKNKIDLIEAGAQGEHKISRGYNPTLTYSTHWIRNSEMKSAIKDFLEREKNIINYNFKLLSKSTPYKA